VRVGRAHGPTPGRQVKDLPYCAAQMTGISEGAGHFFCC
jgi:hypothetical protein